MLPFALPTFATTDAAANVAVIEGVNDNVSQTRDANGNLDRHPAEFTGLDGRGTLRFTNRDSDVQTLTLRARTEAYVGLDQPNTVPPSGTLTLGYISGFTLTPRSNLALTANANLTTVTGARSTDATLPFTLDPAAISTSVASYSAFGTYSYTLSPRWSLAETAGATITTTLSSPGLQLANGVVLDRTGLDGVVPSSTTTLSRELGPRDALLITFGYRYTYSPYSLSIGTNPPQIGGPESIHQFVPSLGLSHQFSDTVSSTTSAGISVATPQAFETDRRLIFFPVGSETLMVTGARWKVRALASVTYSSVSARLGAGPTYSLSGTIAGTPLEGRAYRSMYLIGTLGATRSTVPTATGDTAALAAVSAGAELRYGLTRWLGLYTGYDVRGTSSITPNDPPYIRQIFFIGLSGYFTTADDIPPIETQQSPYTPG